MIKHTHHAQSIALWESGNTCKMVEGSQWMDEWGLSQCFLQPLTSTRAHLLPPTHKCLLCLGHAGSHVRGNRGLRFKVIHTQPPRLQLQILLLPNQRVELVSATKHVFLAKGCAFFYFPPDFTHSTLGKRKTHEMKPRIRSSGWFSDQSRQMGPGPLSPRPRSLLVLIRLSVWKTGIFV